MSSPFHFAFPVKNLEETKRFYTHILGCKEGRSTDKWIDFDFFGNQISAHLSNAGSLSNKTSLVDSVNVPIPHFGAILEREDWNKLSEKLTLNKIQFEIEPQIRFKNEPGEQATMFFKDPSGNCLEFKSFNDNSKIYSH